MIAEIIPDQPIVTASRGALEPIPSEPGVMIVGKPGDLPPEGYQAAPMTPRVLRRSLFGMTAVRLVECWQGARGPGVSVELSDGISWPAYLLDLEDICDPLFDRLSETERGQIAEHFMSTPPVALYERFLLQEKPTFTLLRRCAGVRLWRSQTVAHELHGAPRPARTHYHITEDSEASFTLMRDYGTALSNFEADVASCSGA